MRLVSCLLTSLLISAVLLSSSGFAQEIDLSDIEPVTFNDQKKDPAKVKALIDDLLGEETPAVAVKNTKETDLSSQTGAK